jgi:hypothetical protein
MFPVPSRSCSTRFYIMNHMGNAVDTARRRELAYNRDNFPKRDQPEFKNLRRANLNL